jgi:hypothetical protein
MMGSPTRDKAQCFTLNASARRSGWTPDRRKGERVEERRRGVKIRQRRVRGGGEEMIRLGVGG